MSWKRAWVFPVVLLALGMTCAVPDVAAAGPRVATADGSLVDWTDWVSDQGPVAVLLWASWTPGARSVIDDLDEFKAAAAAKNLGLVVVSVQEGIDDSRRGLGSTNVEWLHDRYGGLLKHHRVVTIPALIIVTADGEVLARLDPTVAALRGWKGQ